MRLMQPAKRFSKLCAVRATATGLKSAAMSFPKAFAVRLLGRGHPRCVGNISGRASSAEIVANVAGAGFTARLDVWTQGERQSVAIRPQGGTDVTAVAIALRKG